MPRPTGARIVGIVIAVALALAPEQSVYPPAAPAYIDTSFSAAESLVEPIIPVRVESSTSAPTRVRRRARQTQSPVTVPRSTVEHIVRAAAVKWGINPDRFVAVAKCESGLNPRAQSPHGKYVGIFQFDIASWTSRSRNAGFGGRPWWDAKANAGTAAWLWKTSGPSHWPTCSQRHH